MRCRISGLPLRASASLLAAALSVGLIAPVRADTAADELIRQQERERALRDQLETQPDVRLPRPAPTATPDAWPEHETPCFAIQHVRLVGDAAEQFQWALHAVDDLDGRCLGSQGVNVAMTRIQNAIVARGYVTTRVLAGPQELKSGELVLTLMPGRIRAIRFAAGSNPRATQFNAVPARPGDLLNLRDIEQALENFKRVPTAEADIQITPADGADAQPGQSDLVISWQQAFPFRVNLSADDSGSKSTGKYQGSITVSYDDWWTLNDLFYVTYNHDLGVGAGGRGTHGYTVHYEIPYGYWMLGLTNSSYDYFQSVAGANQTYIYSGTSLNNEIKLSRLVYRDASRKTSLYARGWTRSSNNYIDDTEVGVQRRVMAGWEAGFSHRELLGNASLDFNGSYKRGTGAHGSLQAPEEAFGEGTARPTILNADAQLNAPFQWLGQNLRFNTSWRAQWNRTPLVPQDRFSIAGRYTVRGFDGENSLSAERGWLWRNDLAWALGGSGQELYVGADMGKVSGPSAQQLLGQRLAGYVLGLRGGYRGFGYDVFVGQPISKPTGFETDPTTAGFSLNWSF
ncbi:ShlB/FhaC/HecB family hemolysin secretion/activation protein [Amantichitinum ursilacus]|uniref:Filamentous hemagglutinin transporter protein FhaC n=1 Tax=Amantichitinum ursilacus TaxID=857265 RepID=A0A0N0XLS5_9NEIS|nr:ShlB/FhaC/HecB family hemolysin secretion/activation protein [Amantichitinum ursilacus]KPC54396.1 Filamentous hemagglutinin transporter protein FhaC precursor [Amantichitinum ursilacus]